MSIGIIPALLYFLIPLALTIILEAFVGVAFRLSRKEQQTLLLINIVTNLSVNLLLYFYRLFTPWRDAYAIVFLEIAVIIVEWLLFQAFFEGKHNRFVFSLACNAASCGAGLALWFILF